MEGRFNMDIKTERLHIIPCTHENYIEYVNQYTMGPHIEMHLEELKKDPHQLGWGSWFVINNETKQVIGDVGFKGMPTEHNTVEIGYGIIEEAQNRGFATEAVKGIIDWAFSTGKVEEIIAECLIDNEPSIKVLRKLGMKQTDSQDGMYYWSLIK